MIDNSERHGRSYEPLYKVWTAMKTRCNASTNINYVSYGGRGITVCEEWQHSYPAFKNWALENGYAPGLSIDRIDNNGNYEPSNCRWTTRLVQQNNTRKNRNITFNNETHSISEWARIMHISKSCLIKRLDKWTLEEAMTRDTCHSKWDRNQRYFDSMQELKQYLDQGLRPSEISEITNTPLPTLTSRIHNIKGYNPKDISIYEIHKTLIKFKEENGLTNKRVAELIGVSENFVSRLTQNREGVEHMQSTLQMSTYEKLRDFFDDDFLKSNAKEAL